MTRILFVGDSITDAGRIYDNPADVGRGYAMFVKAFLGVQYPDYEFFNRGINGNRVVDIYARVKKDIINLKPDVLSIFVGVNDVRYEIEGNFGTETSKFITIYKMLLDDIKEALPSVKIFLITPFVLEGRSTKNTDAIPDRFERLKIGVAEKAEAVKAIAAEYNLPVMELQSEFNNAVLSMPVDRLTVDGVHPTPEGHELIKRLWIKTVEKFYGV